MTTYKQFNEILVGRNAKSKKIANNTYAIRLEDNSIAIKLHQTNILTYFPDGRIVFNTGGWKTSTTKERINSFSPVRISQNKGIWYASYDDWNKQFIFKDGMEFSFGIFKNFAEKNDLEKENELRKKIREYCKLVSKSLPLERPSGGDCWFCGMRTQEDKKPLGESTHDISHLESHMEEKYIVPSLVYRALEVAGAGQAWFWYAFKGESVASPLNNWQTSQIAKYTKRYLYKQFGLAV